MNRSQKNAGFLAAQTASSSIKLLQPEVNSIEPGQTASNRLKWAQTGKNVARAAPGFHKQLCIASGFSAY